MTHSFEAMVGRVAIIIVLTWIVGIILALLGVFNRMIRK